MKERRSRQPAPQETRLFNPNILAEQALIKVLQGLPVPITITPQVREQDGKAYYTYQVGEKTEEKPFGLRMGATPDFLEAVQISLEAAIQRPMNTSHE